MSARQLYHSVIPCLECTRFAHRDPDFHTNAYVELGPPPKPLEEVLRGRLLAAILVDNIEGVQKLGAAGVPKGGSHRGGGVGRAPLSPAISMT